MTFDELSKVNKTIRKTDIKGKDYAEVNERVRVFRMLYPEGCISTDIVSLENGVCVMRASVFDNDMNLLSTGTAYEKEGSTYINKTSYIENCETSAVGRALAMLGIGIDTSIASVEEVKNAMEQQEVKLPKLQNETKPKEEKAKENNPLAQEHIADETYALEKDVKKIREWMLVKNIDILKVSQAFGFARWGQMPMSVYEQIVEGMEDGSIQKQFKKPIE